jgi:hypothetical protein
MAFPTFDLFLKIHAANWRPGSPESRARPSLGVNAGILRSGGGMIYIAILEYMYDADAVKRLGSHQKFVGKLALLAEAQLAPFPFVLIGATAPCAIGFVDREPHQVWTKIEYAGGRDNLAGSYKWLILQ